MAASNDPSLRYVLPESSPLLGNLAVLWAIDPALAEAIEATESQPSYPVERSRSGAPTLAAEVGGRQLYLHSRHQPIDEAKRLIDDVAFDQKLFFCVYGFGLGYHVEALLDRASDEAIIAVLEPDLVLLRTAFEQRDLSHLLESRRVMFITRLDKGELYQRLTPHMALSSAGMALVAHPPSLQLQPDFHRQMQVWLGEFISYCRTSLNTLVINGRRTAENIARNVGWYAASPSLSRLKDRYRGRPAIVVSAGPSLRKNKHLLPAAADKSIIIAVQTTLQPLLEMGVRPDFVTSLDYHEICTRFFDKLPADLRTELVAEPKATDAIFGLHPGPLSLLGNPFADDLLREMKLGKSYLPAGATVAHLAYYLAEHLGCDPIIFVGQDLGFSDGLAYTPGTSYEDVWRPELGRFCTIEMKQWEQVVRDRRILRKIPDYQGRPMYTEERLFTYLQQFERDFSLTRTRIIDATEGGALKRGAAVMPLAEALNEFCAGPILRGDDHPGYRWELLPQCLTSLDKRDDEARQIEIIARDTLPLLEEIRDHIADRERVNRTIARIDILRAKMNDLGQCYDLITQLTQLTELRRFYRDRHIAAARVEGMELQSRQVGRDIDNARDVADAAGAFRKLMTDASAHVAEMVERYRKGKAA